MHANTLCIGRHTLILNDYDIPVTVYGYGTFLVSQTFRTVSAITAYDLFQPKMSPALSLYGMYRKSYIYPMNRTNSQ